MTPTDLANYVRCPHRVFLDKHGDPAAKLPPNAFTELLWAGGLSHEATVIDGLDVATVDTTLSYPERAAATHALMAQGVAAIYHGILILDDLRGEPDLLVRSDRLVTEFGVYGYIPVDVKNGKAFTDVKKSKPKAPYAMQLCAYAEMLQFAQGCRPPIGQIIDADGVWNTYDLDAFWPEYERLRDEAVATIKRTKTTEPGWQASCASCAWQQHCWAQLVATDDLTTVDGVGASYKERLYTIGVRTASELAEADPETLVGVKGIKLARAQVWTRKARVQKSGSPLFLQAWAPPDVDFEVSYDIEDYSLDPYVYLHGLLVRPRGARLFGSDGHTEADFGTFEPVCATWPEPEEAVWRAFLAKVADIDARGTYVVYVYSHHERTTLKRLAAKYGGSDALDRFMKAFVDLERVMKRSVVMPTDSSSLKAYARFAGFTWRDDDPGGSQSLAWWNAYWTDAAANAELRERVIRYNEDDVRASFVVRDWLARHGVASALAAQSPDMRIERPVHEPS